MGIQKEKRRSSRIGCRVRAEYTLVNTRYKGFIENFSREGILKTIYNNQQELYISPGTMLVVSFRIPSASKLDLPCEVRWIRHAPDLPFGIKHYIGMEIYNPPQKYKDFIQELYYLYYKSILHYQNINFIKNSFIKV
jgi:hypothetical protein